MQAVPETQTPASRGGNSILALTAGAADERDVMRLAEIFAVTPEAARLAVARVGTDFRDLQRELGGRR